MANPFIIPNAGVDVSSQLAGLGQSLAGLGNTLAAKREKEAKLAKIQKAEQRFKDAQSAIQSALESNDRDAIIETAIAYPEAKQMVDLSLGLADSRSKEDNAALQSELDLAATRVASDPAAAISEAQRIRGWAQQRGLPTPNLDRAIASAEVDPEATQDEIATILKMRSPQIFKAQRDEKLALAKDDREERALVLKAEKQAADLKAAGKTKVDVKTVRDISTDVSKDLKDAKQIKSAATALVSLKEESTATDQLAAIFKLMKALDPTSVVRGEEQQQAASTGGTADAFRGYINQIQGKGKLTPEVFQNMVDTAKRLANNDIERSTAYITTYLDGYGDLLPQDLKDRQLARVPKLFAMDADQAGTTSVPPVNIKPEISERLNKYLPR